MTWFRVDDGFESHPKVLALHPKLADAALALWVRAGSWSGRQLTDGFVPQSYVDQLRKRRAALELVRVRLWDKVDDGFRFHDFKTHNPLRSEVLARREKETEKKRKMRAGKVPDAGACPPGCPPGTDPDCPPPCPPLSRPDPTRPGPTDPDPLARSADASVPEVPSLAQRRARRAGPPPMPPLPGVEDPMQRVYALVRLLQSELPNIATHDTQSWADDWAWIASRPPKQLRAVIATLQGSAWAARSWQHCTPRHIRKYWAVYASGTEPRPPNGHGPRPAAAVPERGEFNKLAEQTPQWLKEGE